MHHETPSEAITKLLYTYAERIDAGDFAGVAEVFAHATLTFEGFPDTVSGAPAVQAVYERTTRRYEDGTPRTKHVMTNVMVDVDDDEMAAAQPVLLHRAPGGSRRTGAATDHRRALPPRLHLPWTDGGSSPPCTSSSTWSATSRTTCSWT